MKAITEKIDLRILATYLAGALLALGIVPLLSLLRPPAEDAGLGLRQFIADAVLQFYLVSGFLLLAVITGAFGWYKSERQPARKSFAWAFAIGLLALLLFWATTVSL